MIERTFTVGQPVRARGVFRDRDGDLTDPDPVIVRVLRPDGVQLTYIYGEDDEVIRDSEGVFALTVRTAGSPAGNWTVAFEGGSDDETIFDESVFYADPSRFDMALDSIIESTGITAVPTASSIIFTLPSGLQLELTEFDQP